ncbi:hypothetical protein D3C87_1365650 [compost metagenome]
MPARMPSGVPNSVATPTITKLPKMALARPPPAVLGAGVIWVNRSSDRPPTPSEMVVQRIHASQNRPKSMAASDAVSA